MGLKRKIRLTLFKSVHLFDFLAQRLISSGYFIRASAWFVAAKVPFFEDRIDIYDYLVAMEPLVEQKISYLEFGVSKGLGFHYWYRMNKHPESRFIGFDTFMGLPENWGSEAKGTYSAGGVPPEIDDGESRCEFVVGLFQDTLDDFIGEFLRDDSRLIILMDADLYNATLYLMLRIAPMLKAGDIIVFDEFFSVTKADTEFRAFLDYLQVGDMSYRPLAKSHNQFAIVIE